MDPDKVVVSAQPQEGKPCLQSTRLTIDAKTTISKTTLTKLGLLLKELNFPEAPIPTRAAMDLMDNIRKNALGLLSMQSAIKAKVKKIESLRGQLGSKAPEPSSIFVPVDSFVSPAAAEEASGPAEATLPSAGNSKRKSTNPKKVRFASILCHALIFFVRRRRDPVNPARTRS